jgi:hypothetical protein
VHARAATDALAKQAALHAVAMLKGEVVNQFTTDHLGSTAKSVSSMDTISQRPVSLAMSLMHEPPPQPAALSRLGVLTSPSSEMQFMAAGGAFPPAIDLNRMPVAGESSSGHNKDPRARAAEDLPDAFDLFGQMPTQPMVDEVLPWSSPLVCLHRLSCHGHCPMQDATQDDNDDCMITGVDTQHGPTCNIDGEPLIDEALLAATQASRHSHRTGAYTNKEDLVLCDAWLHIGTNLVSHAEQKGGCFWRRVILYFHEHRKFSVRKLRK